MPKIPSAASALIAIISLAYSNSAQADFLVKANDVMAICDDWITEQKTCSSSIEDYFLS